MSSFASIMVIYGVVFVGIVPIMYLFYLIVSTVSFSNIFAIIKVKKNKQKLVLCKFYSDNNMVNYSVGEIIFSNIIQVDKKQAAFKYVPSDIYYSYGLVPTVDLFESDNEARTPKLKQRNPINPGYTFQVISQLIHTKAKSITNKDALLHPLVLGIIGVMFLIIVGLIVMNVASTGGFNDTILQLSKPEVITNVVTN